MIFLEITRSICVLFVSFVLTYLLYKLLLDPLEEDEEFEDYHYTIPVNNNTDAANQEPVLSAQHDEQIIPQIPEPSPPDPSQSIPRPSEVPKVQRNLCPDCLDCIEDEASNSNYDRLQFVFQETVPVFLRNVFKEMWLLSEGCPWEDTKANGLQLLLIINWNSLELQKSQKDSIASGNSPDWSFPLLCTLIEGLITDNPSIPPCLNLVETTLSNLETLKTIRASLTPSLSSEEFQALWETTSSTLTSMGLPKVLLEQKPRNPHCSRVCESAEKSAKEFKRSGNEFYKEKNMISAIIEYTKGLETPHISHELLSVLFSNRSAARLQLNDFKAAESDAKTSVEIRPHWPRGHLRLGSVYEKQLKYDKALECFMSAKSLGDNSPSTSASIELCILKRTQFERSASLDSAELQRQSENSQQRHKNRKLMGIPDFDESTPYGLCAMGNRYEFGRDGFPVDYAKALSYFSRAAELGNAEGIYNMARLTQEGKGVEVDLKKGYELLLKAASMPAISENVKGSGIFFRDHGVMSACHSLGMAYQAGVYVESDGAKAIEWYHKALRMGSGLSANNIAVIMFSPDPADATTACEYWQLSAHLGTVRAMENLAQHFFHQTEEGDDRISAQNWFLYALHHGSTELETQRDLFISHPLQEKLFSSEKYAVTLEKAVRGSTLGPLLKEIEAFLETGLTMSREANKKEELIEIKKPCPPPPMPFKGKADLIIRHRIALCGTRKKLRKPQNPYTPTPPVPKTLPTSPIDLSGLKEIFLKELIATEEEKLYEGRFLRLTVIEDAILGNLGIGLLVQDSHHEVWRLCIFNHPQRGKETHNELGYGCAISVISPQVRQMADGNFGIRVENPSLVLKHAELKNTDRCRYCGKAYGKNNFLCRKCRRVSYCSKLCLNNDATHLKHDLICYKAIP